MISRGCWCGNPHLEAFSDDYAACRACGTLVTRAAAAPDLGQVDDNERGFYGRDYWWSHQRRLGLPPIADRAHADLTDRCPHWLATLLAYRLPPARIVEIGAGHGGFVAMLRAAGFDASGVELSPAIVAFARETFDVPMQSGSIEAQAIEPASLDAVVMTDVLEHLSDPEAAIRRAAAWLRPDGLFLVQMPQYEEAISHAALREENAPFLRLVDGMGTEHQHLFSRRAAARLFAACGFAQLTFEAPVFAYDMLFVAGRDPLRRNDSAMVAGALARTPQGRLLAALLDVYDDRARTRQALAEAETDRAARLVNATTLQRLLDAQVLDARAQRAHIETLTAVVEAQARQLRLAAQQQAEAPDPLPAASTEPGNGPAVPPLIAIDVTPVQPGSINGGAKPLTLDLVRRLTMAGRHRYLLLTSCANHDEFAVFEGAGARRVCVDGAEGTAQTWTRQTTLIGHGVDVLFCPMTDPYRAEPGVATVSLVLDLQHVDYPAFIPPEEAQQRSRYLSRVAATADMALCISDFTRASLTAHSGMPAWRTSTLCLAVHDRLPDADADARRAVREAFPIDAPYALYPANFWPHKNHRLLLTAFAVFLRERPHSRLRLVLVGDPLEQGADFDAAVREMGLEQRVRRLGFVSDVELSALWSDAFCLLYPSLYEGFGLPLLEAMRFRVPIVCSRAGSLPEVAGDAALYVDPRKPGTIVEALTLLDDMPALRDTLIARGIQRLRHFDPAAMLDQLTSLFERLAVDRRRALVASVAGVFDDGWLGPEVLTQTGDSPAARQWRFDIAMPEWHPLPVPHLEIEVEVDGQAIERQIVPRGATRRLEVPVPRGHSRMRLSCRPTFVPDPAGDVRELSAILTMGQLFDLDRGTVIHEIR